VKKMKSATAIHAISDVPESDVGTSQSIVKPATSGGSDPIRNGLRRPKRERSRSLRLPTSGPLMPSHSLATPKTTLTTAGASSSSSVANFRK
jgi:hypothetical protein